MLVPRHGRRGVPEPRHPDGAQRRLHRGAGGRPRLQDGLRADCSPTTWRMGARCTVACIEVPSQRGQRLRRDGGRRQRRIARLRREAGQPAGDARQARPRAGQHGHLRLQRRVPVRRRSSATWPIPSSSHDFGKDIIPAHRARGRGGGAPVRAVSCVGSTPEATAYWRDVGTIDAYWDANIDLTATEPAARHVRHAVADLTYQQQLPPAKFVHNQDDRRGRPSSRWSRAAASSPARVFRSVLFSSVRVHSHSLGELVGAAAAGGSGPGVRLNRVVVDRGCVHPRRHGHRRGRGRGRAPLLPHRPRHHAGHAGHARGAGSAGRPRP